MRPKSKFGYVNHDLWAVMDRARKQVPMSALGQKQTFGPRKSVSALPQKQTSVERIGMSALCQKRTLRCCTRSPDRRAAAGKVEQTAQATLAGLRRERQAMALFLMAPMIAVSMAPPAPPAITCETMPPILRLPDSAAATTDGSANVAIWPSTPQSDQPGNNVSNSTKVKRWRCLTCASSTKRSCD